MKQGIIVTIDGPSGSGKSTVARLLADRLGYTYIDTGAMYRGIGWLAREEGVPFRECKELDNLLKTVKLSFEEKNGRTYLVVNGMDLTERVRTPEMGMVASRISEIGTVRRWLSSLQRRLGEEGNAVLEGRDMGTVVFPDADYKFYLVASLEVRGRRRAEQLREKGEEADLEATTKEISFRDRNDSTRALAPLRKAEDAIEVDTTSLSVSEVLERLLRETRAEKRKGRKP